MLTPLDRALIANVAELTFATVSLKRQEDDAIYVTLNNRNIGAAKGDYAVLRFPLVDTQLAEFKYTALDDNGNHKMTHSIKNMSFYDVVYVLHSMLHMLTDSRIDAVSIINDAHLMASLRKEPLPTYCLDLMGYPTYAAEADNNDAEEPFVSQSPREEN